MELVVLAGGILAVLALTITTLYFFWPGAVLKVLGWYRRRKLGLVVRYSYCGSYRFCYASRGTPQDAVPSLLLLHGFSANKDTWQPIINFLPRSQHVVCLDMPGHEGTSRLQSDDYTFPGQAHRVHQFVQSIGLDKRPFHLAGESMGGCVAGVYAIQYPTYLSSVTLICPAGLVSPVETEYMSQLKKLEKNPHEWNALIPCTFQEMEDMLNLCCHKALNLPRQVIQGLLDNRIPNNDFYRKVLIQLIGEDSCHFMQENLHMIKTPALVVWGKEDQLVHVSGVEVLQAGIPNCRVELLDNCGHSLSLDRPRKTTKIIMDFLSAQAGNSENTKKNS